MTFKFFDCFAYPIDFFDERNLSLDENICSHWVYGFQFSNYMRSFLIGTANDVCSRPVGISGELLQCCPADSCGRTSEYCNKAWRHRLQDAIRSCYMFQVDHDDNVMSVFNLWKSRCSGGWYIRDGKFGPRYHHLRGVNMMETNQPCRIPMQSIIKLRCRSRGRVPISEYEKWHDNNVKKSDASTKHITHVISIVTTSICNDSAGFPV
jgi:hypothetical protein